MVREPLQLSIYQRDKMREREKEKERVGCKTCCLFLHICIIRFCSRAWNVNNFLKGDIGKTFV